MRVFGGDGTLNAFLLEHVPVSFAVFDTEMRYVACSRRWRDDYRLGDQDLIGHSNYEIFPGLSDDWKATGQRALAGETLACDGEMFDRSDGFLDYVRWAISPWYDSDGKIGGVVIWAEKLNGQLEHARAEAAHAEYLRSILDAVPDAMITTDEKGIVQSFSSAAEAMFGYKRAEVLGRNVSMLMPEPEASRHDGYLTRYRATRKRRVIHNTRRMFGRRSDGSIFPHLVHVGEALVGEQRLFTGFVRDLTEQEEAEAKLHELQAELIHIARVSAVGTMATALAHELNQPLTAITNYVQASASIIGSGEEGALDLVRDALEEAGQEALRAGAIVQRLREFVSSGELERTIVRPQTLARFACDLGGVDGRTRGISCEIDISEDLAPVLVDRVQIQQVLLNLVRNASEALLDQQGKITITAQEDGAMTRFSVIDDGPGIAHGDEEVVFEPFISSKASGMGMGLAICRTIIEAHGGRMWCEAENKGGATFHFTVPRAEADNA